MPLLLRILAEVRRQVLIRRRTVAALCAGIGAFAVVHALAPSPPASIPVWTLSRDVLVGSQLARDDLHLIRVAATLAPRPRVRDPAGLLGRTVITPLQRGQPLSRSALLDEHTSTGYPGRSVMAVRLALDVARLLHPGDRVDLWATGEHADANAVTEDAVVVAVPAAEPQSGFSGTPSAGLLVVLAVPVGDVGDLASASASGFLTVAWNR